MKLEQQVTSVKVSNQLRKVYDELGVQKSSLFYREWTGAKEHEIDGWGKPDWCEDNIPCYTFSELIELLGEKFGVFERLKSGKFGAYIPNDIGVSATGEFAPDVLAELLMKTLDDTQGND